MLKRLLFTIFIVCSYWSNAIIYLYLIEYDDDTEIITSNINIIGEYHKLSLEHKELEEKYNKYDKFREIMAKHDWRGYNREDNNCYMQSQQIQKDLLEEGIDSSIFINKDRSHAWLGVWIEATEGDFTVRGNQGPVAEIRDHNLKVICN